MTSNPPEVPHCLELLLELPRDVDRGLWGPLDRADASLVDAHAAKHAGGDEAAGGRGLAGGGQGRVLLAARFRVIGKRTVVLFITFKGNSY